MLGRRRKARYRRVRVRVTVTGSPTLADDGSTLMLAMIWALAGKANNDVDKHRANNELFMAKLSGFWVRAAL